MSTDVYVIPKRSTSTLGNKPGGMHRMLALAIPLNATC
jgi:hypothetical protein